MNLPDLHIDTSHFGNWVAPEDISTLIPLLAARYYDRYKTEFYGDEEDLSQEAHLALWLLLKDREDQERVRELEALSVVTGAIQKEIHSTRRSGPGVLSSQDDSVPWKALACVDRNLSEHQQYALTCFRNRVAQIVKKPAWEFIWLVLGCGWEPEEVCLWFRRKPDDRQRFSPADVRKRVRKAAREVRFVLDREYETEINQISMKWW
jgi:hypothetical protein